MNYDEYGSYVLRTRTRLGLSRRYIIDHSGGTFTQANLAKIELSGRVPTADQEEYIYDLLGVRSVAYLNTMLKVAKEFDIGEYRNMLESDDRIELKSLGVIIPGDIVKVIETQFPLTALKAGCVGVVEGIYSGVWGVLLDVFWYDLHTTYPMFLDAGDSVEKIPEESD